MLSDWSAVTTPFGGTCGGILGLTDVQARSQTFRKGGVELACW